MSNDQTPIHRVGTSTNTRNDFILLGKTKDDNNNNSPNTTPTKRLNAQSWTNATKPNLPPTSSSLRRSPSSDLPKEDFTYVLKDGTKVCLPFKPKPPPHMKPLPPPPRNTSEEDPQRKPEFEVPEKRPTTSLRHNKLQRVPSKPAIILSKNTLTQLLDDNLPKIQYKLVRGQCGKTSLLQRFVQNQFEPSDTTSTVESMFKKSIIYDNQGVKECITLTITDTSGDDSYEFLRESWCRGADGYMIVFSLTSKTSYDEALMFYNTLIAVQNKKSIPIVAVGTALDSDGRKISHEEALKLGVHMNTCPVVEASAKTGQNVELAFLTLIREIKQATQGTKKNKIHYKHAFRTAVAKQGTMELDDLSIEVPTTVFGLPFAEVVTVSSNCDWSNKYQRPNNECSEMPDFLRKALDYLLRQALPLKGIFRLSGSVATVNQLKARVDKGEFIDFEEENVDPFDASGLVRLYLKELPEPIFTYEYYDGFMTVQQKCKSPRYLLNIAKLLLKIPIVNRMFLRSFTLILRAFSKFDHLNKMPASSLAIVFSTSLIYPEDKNPMVLLQDMALITNLFTAFITQHDEIFSLVDLGPENLERKMLETDPEQ